MRLEARSGKGPELGAFLQQGRELVMTENGTVTWYAFQISDTEYGIFDSFESEDARETHRAGALAKAIGSVTSELLATAPKVLPVKIVAAKSPKVVKGKDDC